MIQDRQPVTQFTQFTEGAYQPAHALGHRDDRRYISTTWRVGTVKSSVSTIENQKRDLVQIEQLQRVINTPCLLDLSLAAVDGDRAGRHARVSQGLQIAAAHCCK